MAAEPQAFPVTPSPRRWLSGELEQRIAAVMMVCLQAATLGYLSRTLIFPAIIAGLAVVNLALPRRLTLTPRLRFWITSGIIIAFIAKFLVAPVNISFGRYFIRSQFAHAFAQGLLTLQIFLLYVSRERPRLPFGFAGIGMLSLFFACDVKVNPQERFVTQVLMLGFLCAVVWFFNENRRWVQQESEARPRLALRFLQVLILLIVCGLALQSSSLLLRHERTLEQWVIKLFNMGGESGVGFSGRAELGSVAGTKGKSSRKIALRVESKESPGYLRGRAFESFEHSEWVTRRLQRSAGLTQAPVPGMRPQQSQEQIFSLVSTQSFSNHRRPSGSIIRVYPELDRSSTVFTKLGTTHVTIGVNQLAFNIQGVPMTADQLMTPYSAFVPDGPTQAHPDLSLPESNADPYLTIPRELDPRVEEEIARTLFPEGLTTAEKIQRVEIYFRETYEYNFGIEIPAGQDPINYFLLEKPAAHCEYFASGAAILLRLAGIPTRYVTGFLAVEQNPYTKQWIARNEHAHAWVEAWDEERGWVTVEPTPSSGQPSEGDPSAIRQYLESIRARFATWREEFHQNGLLATIGIVLLALMFPWGLMIVGICALIWLWKHRDQFRREKPTWRTPALARLQKLLDQMLNSLRGHKWEPAPGETLHQFAARVRSTATHRPNWSAAAEWIEQYSEVRYQEPIEESEVLRLAEALSEWKRTLG